MCSSLKFIQDKPETSNAESVLYYAKKVYEILQVDLIDGNGNSFIVLFKIEKAHLLNEDILQ